MGNCLRYELEMYWFGEDWDDDFIIEYEEE